MSLLCYFGRHKPSVHSISRGKQGGYGALCDSCGVPLERNDAGAWRVAAPSPAQVHPRTER
ncbi:hypothetical protein FMM79_18975 [Novosphingobium sp. BW1]|nr:hypothetical protein FMM79_18975 [Novosphingobium sp. BW1]